MTGTFKDTLAAGYKLDEPGIVLGSPLDGATVYPDVRIQVALSMLSRHGLIAGATGTGKTKTLQVIAGQLSARRRAVPRRRHQGRRQRAWPCRATRRTPRSSSACADLGLTYARPATRSSSCRSAASWARSSGRRSTPSGRSCSASVLDLNDTQTCVLSLVFKYCDDNALPLLDLADLRRP